jgi:IS5 family transposase
LSLGSHFDCRAAGEGKPHEPYEFGVKVSVATTLKRRKGGQFAIHVNALPGNPYNGHTLAKIISAIEQLIGNQIERLHADAGYRGLNGPPDYRFRIYTSKQKRRIRPPIKREMRRRAAVEPVIGHLKNEYRMDRNYLHHRSGDAKQCDPRHNRLQLQLLLRLILAALPEHPRPPPNPTLPESAFFTVDSVSRPAASSAALRTPSDRWAALH